MLQHVSALTDGLCQEARKLLACANYAAAYLVGILHVIKIIIIKIKC